MSCLDGSLARLWKETRLSQPIPLHENALFQLSLNAASATGLGRICTECLLYDRRFRKRLRSPLERAEGLGERLAKYYDRRPVSSSGGRSKIESCRPR